MDRALPVARLLTRRRVLRDGGIAVAGLTLWEPARALAARTRGLHRSDYTPWVGHRFRLAVPDLTPVLATLVGVLDFPGRAMRPLKGSQDAFILIFRAPPEAPRLGQAVTDVGHPQGYTTRLLLSPNGMRRPGFEYAAVINRARPIREVSHV
jgi:hypothetical protein